eukprot:3361004-Rhodomonas_salina.1
MALGVREHGLAPCARSGTWQPGGIACGTKMVDAAIHLQPSTSGSRGACSEPGIPQHSKSYDSNRFLGLVAHKRLPDICLCVCTRPSPFFARLISAWLGDVGSVRERLRLLVELRLRQRRSGAPPAFSLSCTAKLNALSCLCSTICTGSTAARI